MTRQQRLRYNDNGNNKNVKKSQLVSRGRCSVKAIRRWGRTCINVWLFSLQRQAQKFHCDSLYQQAVKEAADVKAVTWCPKTDCGGQWPWPLESWNWRNIENSWTERTAANRLLLETRCVYADSHFFYSAWFLWFECSVRWRRLQIENRQRKSLGKTEKFRCTVNPAETHWCDLVKYV